MRRDATESQHHVAFKSQLSRPRASFIAITITDSRRDPIDCKGSQAIPFLKFRAHISVCPKAASPPRVPPQADYWKRVDSRQRPASRVMSAILYRYLFGELTAT